MVTLSIIDKISGTDPESRVGHSLNQILRIANACGLLEVPPLRKALDRNRELEVRIADAYTKE